MTAKTSKLLKRLLLGKHPWRTLCRAVVMALAALILFGYVLRPVRIHGESMAPTVRDATFRFANFLRYRRQDPKAGDIVVIRMAGRQAMYLKRVLAVPGDRIAFEYGMLRRNGEMQPEPYVIYRGDWRMREMRLGKDEFFVAGDNRSQSLQEHVAGVVHRERILGGLLF